MATKLIRINKQTSTNQEKSTKPQDDTITTDLNKEHTQPLSLGKELKSTIPDKIVLGQYNRDYKTNLLEIGSGNSRKRRNSLEIKKETGLVTAPVNANVELVDKIENNGILITKNYLTSKINNLKHEIDSLKKLINSYNSITKTLDSKLINISDDIIKHSQNFSKIRDSLEYVERKISEIKEQQKKFESEIDHKLNDFSKSILKLDQELDKIQFTIQKSTYTLKIVEPTASIINTGINIPTNTVFDINVKVLVSENTIQYISCKLLHSFNEDVHIDQQHLGMQLVSIGGLDFESNELLISLHSAVFDHDFPIYIQITSHTM